MLLAEVCHCAPADEGFILGLHVEHVIDHIPSLVRLNRALQRDAGELPATSESAECPKTVYERSDQNQ